MASARIIIASAAIAVAALLPQAGWAADDVGYMAIRNHDWATAEKQLVAGLEKNPNNVFRQLNLAWVYVQMGRKDDAAAIYRRILMNDQDRVASLPSRQGESIKVLAERGLALIEKR